MVNFTFPEAESVARGESSSVCLLLQLVLGAAVNCDRKNDFIAGLMQLDEMDQAELMSFIQTILDCGAQQTADVAYDEDQLKQRMHELEKVF